MMSNKMVVLLALALWTALRPALAAELQPETVAAWQEHVRAASAQMQIRLGGGKPFLWIDEDPERAARVRQGEIVVAPLVGRGTKVVPGGLIHHWIGAVFIPNSNIDSLLGVVHDYDHYKQIYTPAVTDSHWLGSGGSGLEFSMTWQRRVLFVNAAMEARYVARDFGVGTTRGYSLIDAPRVQQIEDYGQVSQHLLPPDTGAGYIWRIYSISRYQQRDGGVYLELEALALSRDIPSSFRWLVTRVVNRLSVNSLTATLTQTRDAVSAQAAALSARNRGIRH